MLTSAWFSRAAVTSLLYVSRPKLTRGLYNGAFIDSAHQVNANITADSGGTCVCEYTEADPVCKNNVDYLLCKGVVQRDLVTATAAIAALTSVRYPDVRSPCRK